MGFPGELDRGRGFEFFKNLSTDYFIENPPLQPKQEVAGYVEQSGILVPKRFSNLDDVLSSKTPFIIRSEHPQDYQGVSGLLRSFPLSQDRIDKLRDEFGTELYEINWNRFFTESDLRVAWETEDHVLSEIGNIIQEELEHNLKLLSKREIDRYCRLTGADQEQFSSETSYSYWEYLEGVNRTIVADSAVSGRYHIFSGTAENGFYTIVENDEVASYGTRTSEIPEDPKETLLELTKFYESIRHLDRFDGTHCPLIEVQTAGGNNYFLQYHRTVDFNPAQFSLDREPNGDEKEAVFVRGATPEQGIVVDVNYYISNNPQRFSLREEDAGFDIHYHWIFTELMARKRKAQFMQADSIENASKGHVVKSQLFKTPISVVLKRDDSNWFIESGLDSFNPHSNPSASTRLKVISDGRRAFVNHVDG